MPHAEPGWYKENQADGFTPGSTKSRECTPSSACGSYWVVEGFEPSKPTPDAHTFWLCLEHPHLRKHWAVLDLCEVFVDWGLLKAMSPQIYLQNPSTPRDGNRNSCQKEYNNQINLFTCFRVFNLLVIGRIPRERSPSTFTQICWCWHHFSKVNLLTSCETFIDHRNNLKNNNVRLSMLTIIIFYTVSEELRRKKILSVPWHKFVSHMYSICFYMYITVSAYK